jgi:hypothetical protein
MTLCHRTYTVAGDHACFPLSICSCGWRQKPRFSKTVTGNWLPYSITQRRALIPGNVLPVEVQGGVKSQLSAKACAANSGACSSSCFVIRQPVPGTGREVQLPFLTRNSCAKAGSRRFVYSVCVCCELDGWLLRDHEILCEFASTASHPVKRLRFNPGEPDKCRDPTAALTNIFMKPPISDFALLPDILIDEILEDVGRQGL